MNVEGSYDGSSSKKKQKVSDTKDVKTTANELEQEDEVVQSHYEKNKLQYFLINMTLIDRCGTTQRRGTKRALYEIHRDVQQQMQEAWDSYEIGVPRPVRKLDGQVAMKYLVTRHEFEDVELLFNKFFSKIKVGRKEREWFSKLVMLDAMTEVVVRNSLEYGHWDPQWDQCDPDAQRKYHLMLRSLERLWLNLFAACHDSNLLALAEGIRSRFPHFKTLLNARNHSCEFVTVVEMLAQFGINTCAARLSTLNGISRVCDHMIERCRTALESEGIEQKRRNKYYAARFDDELMLPFLKTLQRETIKPIGIHALFNLEGLPELPEAIVQLIKRFLWNGVLIDEVYDGKTPIKDCKENRKCTASIRKVTFYMEPNVNNWKMLRWEDQDAMFELLKRYFNASHAFSTRRQKKFQALSTLTHCFFHIAFEKIGSCWIRCRMMSDEAFTYTKKGMAWLNNLAVGCTHVEEYVFETTRQFMISFVSMRGTSIELARRKLEKILWDPFLKLLTITDGINEYEKEKEKMKNMFRLIAVNKNPYDSPMHWKMLWHTIKRSKHPANTILNFELEQQHDGTITIKQVKSRQKNDVLKPGMILVALQVTGHDPVNVTFMSLEEVYKLPFWGHRRSKREIVWQQL